MSAAKEQLDDYPTLEVFIEVLDEIEANMDDFTVTNSMENRCLAIFQELDTDGSGGLDEEELARGFAALGIDCDDPAALLAQATCHSPPPNAN